MCEPYLPQLCGLPEGDGMSASSWQDEYETAKAQRARRRRETSTKRQPTGPWSPLWQDADGGWWVNDRFYGADYASAALASGGRP